MTACLFGGLDDSVNPGVHLINIICADVKFLAFGVRRIRNMEAIRTVDFFFGVCNFATLEGNNTTFLL